MGNGDETRIFTIGNSTKMQGSALGTRSNIGNGIELRIFTLGDSITNGFKSSDDNGYRIGLQRELAGSNVLFVGSKTGGTMANGVCTSPACYYRPSFPGDCCSNDG